MTRLARAFALVGFALLAAGCLSGFSTAFDGFYNGSEVAFVFPASFMELPYTDPISGIELDDPDEWSVDANDINAETLDIDLNNSADRVGIRFNFVAAGTITVEAFDGATNIASMAFDFTNGGPPAPQDFIGIVAARGENITRVKVTGTNPSFGGLPSFFIDDLRFQP